jgi:hypothetical protein
MAEQISELFPSSRWNDVQCGGRTTWTNPGLIAARARRRRWQTRTGDTGEAEVEVPEALLDIDSAEIELASDLLLRERVARAVSQVDRAEATRAREKAYDEERAIARERAAASKRPRWLRGWFLR